MVCKILAGVNSEKLRNTSYFKEEEEEEEEEEEAVRVDIEGYIWKKLDQ